MPVWAIKPVEHLSKLPFNIYYRYHFSHILSCQPSFAAIVIHLNKNVSDGINVHHGNIDFMNTNKNVSFLYFKRQFLITRTKVLGTWRDGYYSLIPQTCMVTV